MASTTLNVPVHEPVSPKLSVQVQPYPCGPAPLAHPAVTPELDERSLYHYLSFLTAPAPGTLFRGIQKIPAGHLLICDRRGSLGLGVGVWHRLFH